MKGTEGKSSILLTFVHAPVKLVLLLITLTIVTGSTLARAQEKSGVDLHYSTPQPVAHAAASSSSPTDEGQDEYAELKYSYSVRRLACLVGLSSQTTFRLCRDFNFFLLLALVYWQGCSRVTAALQARSRLIQRTIEEARQFAHEARNRLAEIESRWAQLDSKIASIQALANAELENEKRTLQAKTAEDARRILEYSIQEIEVAEQHARHELKVFAADLAVSIARQAIRIDEKADQGLIGSFVAELGHCGEIA